MTKRFLRYLTVVAIVMYSAVTMSSVPDIVDNSKGDSEDNGDKLVEVTFPLMTSEVEAQFKGVLDKSGWRQVGDEYYQFVRYFLYDITGDGVPELWVERTGAEYERLLTVYRYTPDGCETLMQTACDHSRFYAGPDYLVIWQAHMGNDIKWFYKYKDGKIVLDKHNERHLDEENPSDWYIAPEGQEIEPNEYDNEEPLEPLYLHAD